MPTFLPRIFLRIICPLVTGGVLTACSGPQAMPTEADLVTLYTNNPVLFGFMNSRKFSDIKVSNLNCNGVGENKVACSYDLSFIRTEKNSWTGEFTETPFNKKGVTGKLVKAGSLWVPSF